MAFDSKISCFYLPILLALVAYSICSISSTEAASYGGMAARLIHRDSPLSPYYSPSITRFERMRSEFNRSFSRKASLELASLALASKLPRWFVAKLRPAGGEFLMNFHIGTPPVEVLAIVDTGSSLTWIQCKPCPDCYKQNTTLFDPRKTRTYSNVSCSSKQCFDVQTVPISCDDPKICHYEVDYADNSYTTGDLAMETFTFHVKGRKNVTFPKVAFGCGHSNHGNFAGSSGVIGLGGSPISIMKQLDTFVRGRFSYCLPPRDSSSPGKISFGRKAVVEGPNVSSTPLLQMIEPFGTFYYITLEGFSVGSKKLEYKSTPRSSSNASDDDDNNYNERNILVDSGTTLSLIPSSLAEGIQSAMRQAIDGDPFPHYSFPLCYRVPKGGRINAPSLTAHFKGADMVLPQETVFLEIEEGMACLTLLADDGNPIFGNLHQINYHIGYDLESKKLNFVQRDCTKPF